MSTPALPTPTRGALIAMEGLDRAGKSTQCQLLLKRLRTHGHPCVLQRFPGPLDSIHPNSQIPNPPLNEEKKKELLDISLSFVLFLILTCSDRSTPIGKMIDAYLRGDGTGTTTTAKIGTGTGAGTGTGTGTGTGAGADTRTESTSTSTITTNAGDVEDHAIHLLFSANRWELR